MKGQAYIRSFVFGLRSFAAPFDRVGTKSANFFDKGKCELIANFSATMVTI